MFRKEMKITPWSRESDTFLLDAEVQCSGERLMMWTNLDQVKKDKFTKKKKLHSQVRTMAMKSSTKHILFPLSLLTCCDFLYAAGLFSKEKKMRHK